MPATAPDPSLEIARAIHDLAQHAAGVQLPVRLWDGSALGPEDAPFRIVLNHPWSLRGLLPPSDLAAGRAYVEGDIDVEGDAEAALRIGERLAPGAVSPQHLARIFALVRRLPSQPVRGPGRRARLGGRKHSKARDRRAIEFHYDLPQEFYAAFLDENLVYSCAYFAGDGEDLEAAQIRKLDLVCRKLRLRPGMRLLDIGCGWGALLLHAARNYGVSGVGITLSSTQWAGARQRVQDAGLSEAIEIRREDYRDVRGEFDAVASVGMVEHVGPANLGAYFQSAHRLLRPGGLFCSHGIVVPPGAQRRKGQRTFISEYVFPDGELTPAWLGAQQMEMAGFELIDFEQLRPHYVQTLRAWVARLERNHVTAVAAASEQDYRIWRIYMSGSAHAFASGGIGVVQILGCKSVGGRHDLPMGRAWMLPQAPSGVAGDQRPPG